MKSSLTLLSAFLTSYALAVETQTQALLCKTSFETSIAWLYPGDDPASALSELTVNVCAEIASNTPGK